MKFIIQKKILHETPFKGQPVENPLIFKTFTEVLEKKGINAKESIKVIEPNTYQLKNVSEMNLHSFILEMEKLGKNVELEKSFSITIQ